MDSAPLWTLLTYNLNSIAEIVMSIFDEYKKVELLDLMAFFRRVEKLPVDEQDLVNAAALKAIGEDVAATKDTHVQYEWLVTVKCLLGSVPELAKSDALITTIATATNSENTAVRNLASNILEGTVG